MSKPEVIAQVEDRELDARVLVTGSTSGIGKQTALSLGRLGCDVYVHGRNREAGESVVSDIRDMGQDSKFYQVDFSSQSEVKEFSEEIYEDLKEDGLDILVNNAGGYFRNAGTTEDGVEYTFAVNHLSHFILTKHLLPLLEDSDIGEIVNVSSTAHKSGNMNLEEIQGEEVTSGMKAYGRSKLANIHFTKSLDRRLGSSSINVNAIHPGGIPSSGFFRSLPGPLYKIGKKIGEVPIFDQPEDGAATILYAMLSSETAGESGNYYKNTERATPTKLARDEDVQEKLWNRSVSITETRWDEVL